MMSSIEATFSSRCLSASASPLKIVGACALAFVIGLLAAPPMVRAEGEAKALPDPLTPAAGPASDLNGYFGGGS
ncbi:MAG: hypothetical protein ACR2RE_30730, partial [Geminicoccaceae bacterium]